MCTMLPNLGGLQLFQHCPVASVSVLVVTSAKATSLVMGNRFATDFLHFLKATSLVSMRACAKILKSKNVYLRATIFFFG